MLHLLPVQNETAQQATYEVSDRPDAPHSATRREAYVGATGGVRLAAGSTDSVDHLLALGRGDPGHVVTDRGVAVAPGLGAQIVPEGHTLVTVGARGGGARGRGRVPS